jgi:hypothetical protein
MDLPVTFDIDSLIDGETPGKRYAFTNWKNSAGTSVDSPQTISGPETFTAHYQAQYCLTVNTSPSNLPQPDSFPSGLWYDSNDIVTCAAQATSRYIFDHWILDGVSQQEGNTELIITMDRPHSATACYTPEGDLNSDGKVDETDLIIITGAFHSKTGDKNYDRKMDFDNDGLINIKEVAKIAKNL